MKIMQKNKIYTSMKLQKTEKNTYIKLNFKRRF